MTDVAPIPLDTHQASLVAALDRVRFCLEARAAMVAGSPPPPARNHPESGKPAALSALGTLIEVLGLSPFERDVLLLCAGFELEGDFAALCAGVAGDGRRTYPTFSMALGSLPHPHWSALSPAAPLRYWRLIDVVDVRSETALTASPLRIDEQVLHFLTGVSYLDERLRRLVKHVPPSELSAAHTAISDHVTRAITLASTAGRVAPLVQICGEDPTAAPAIAAAACAIAGLDLYCIPADDLPAGIEGETFLRLWEREAALTGKAILIDLHRCDAAPPRPALAFAQSVQGNVFVASRQPIEMDGRVSVRFDVPRSTAIQRHQMWRQALGPAAHHLNGELDTIASQFDLGVADIRAIGDQVRLVASPDANDVARPMGQLLWDACRARSAPRLAGLSDLARRIETAAGWDDLVLPPAQQRILREITLHVRHRFTVYGTWGFADKGSRGLGIAALFAGASGTGKTMAAEVLAVELGLDLFRVDLSACVSKYIGETEKNLRRIFDAAECGGAVLLFDEADALFGKRSEVKDSHDRHANVEVSYLLQRMETYRGLAILTTNQKSALDTAFLRRLRFIVQFPFPDATQRAEIWRRVFPRQTPTEGLDASKVARLNLSGGNIRNVSLGAAFLAAESGTPVRMGHILAAARSECAKLEKPLTDAEIGGWT